MKEINITIRDKIAENVSRSGYVCGNSDYTVIFDFDSEWDEFDTKTARFIKQDKTFTDVVFSGNQCPMPILSNTYNIYVGVFAGDLHTTTPAHISAKKSILCDGGTPAAPAKDVYAQIMEMLNNIEQPAAEDIQYQATIEETPVENVAQALDLLKEGAGGAKTWADLGETIDFEITWDGSTEGREVISQPMSDEVTLNYYKVSDEYLTANQLVGAVMTVSGVADSAFSSFLPETYTITAEDVTEQDGYVVVGAQYIPLVLSAQVGTELGCSRGVYVLLAEAEVMTQLSGMTIEDNIFATKLKKGDIHTIPADYLPESVAADITTAQSTAEAAQSTAEAAQSTAEAAQSTADNAQTTASRALPKSGGTMTGSLILKGAPSVSLEAATKLYVDTAKSSLTTSIQQVNTVAAEAKSIANTKMGSVNPSGSGSFSMGRRYNSTVGGYSHCEGDQNVAVGYSSHAEGNYTSALGNSSHVEGNGRCTSAYISGSANATEYDIEDGSSSTYPSSQTYIFYNNVATKIVSYDIENKKVTVEKTLSEEDALSNEHVKIITAATGYASHTEGRNTTASGDNSHAEGNETTASGRSSHAEGNATAASGECAHAEGNATTASGDTSHAEGYATSASGNYSHSEGYATTASGFNSHAEGNATIASGTASHAEGGGYITKLTVSGEANAVTYTVNSVSNIRLNDHVRLLSSPYKIAKIVEISPEELTITLDETLSGEVITSQSVQVIRGGASANFSHVEGYATTASGSYAHAEGRNTTASGRSSHAEGNATTASGSYAHAEGCGNTASGRSSHSGGEDTIAAGFAQTVLGAGNIEDTLGDLAWENDDTRKSKHILIVGNGTYTSDGNLDKRHNAHTLDWSGVPWYQGRPQFGGNAQDDGSQTVMGNGDKEIILASSTEGSTKRFRITVDDSGTLSTTEVTE